MCVNSMVKNYGFNNISLDMTLPKYNLSYTHGTLSIHWQKAPVIESEIAVYVRKSASPVLDTKKLTWRSEVKIMNIAETRVL